MKRMIGRTGLVTMMRAAGTAVLAVGVAATAFAADPVGGVAPVAKPLTTAASLLVAPDDTATPDKKEEGQDPAAANPVVEFFKQTELSGFVDGYYRWAFNEDEPAAAELRRQPQRLQPELRGDRVRQAGQRDQPRRLPPRLRRRRHGRTGERCSSRAAPTT